MSWSVAEWQALAGKVGDYVGKVEKVAYFLAANKTAVGIETHLPDGARIIASLGGVDRALALALGALPNVGEAVALYNLYESLGARPFDWGAPENAARARDHEALSGG